MTDEEDGAALHELAKEPHALLDEEGVADGERLIDDQHVRIDVRDDGERQAHDHARRIGFQRLIEKVPDVGKLDDPGIARVDLGGREAHDIAPSR